MSQEELKSYLAYNKNTGVFTWARNRYKVKKGDVAGCLNKGKGYIEIQINRRIYNAHRLAWLYVYGEMPTKQIDHINHIRNDNRLSNLREVSPSTNSKNRSASKLNTSTRTGVYFRSDTNKWRADITVEYKRINLGSFKDFEDAVDAREKAEIKYGFHKNHGQESIKEIA